MGIIPLMLNAITGSSSGLHYVAHSSKLYYDDVKYDNESSSNGWFIRQNQFLCMDINESKGQRSEIYTIKYYTSPFRQMTTTPQRTVKKV